MTKPEGQHKTQKQIDDETAAKEFVKDPSKFAKRSCNSCNGRGVTGHRNVVRDAKGEITNPGQPVICGCATRRFQASRK